MTMHADALQSVVGVEPVKRPKRTKLGKEHPHRRNDEQLVVRLPSDLVDRIDARAEELREAMPGAKLSRADIVRVLLTQALDAADRKGKR